MLLGEGTMNQPKKGGISRRQFARKVALLSASASIVPAASVFGKPLQAPPTQQPADSHPNLPPESQAEAEARYQQILSQYGSRLSAEERREHPWVIVATAHPAKFNEVVEPIIGKTVDIPEALNRLLRMPQHFLDLPPTLQAVAAALE